MRCLLSTKNVYNVQAGIGRCNKTLNNSMTKNGEIIQEVISDYGNGLVTTSEVFSNKIIQTGLNGDKTTYVKNPLGFLTIIEDGVAKQHSDGKIWNKLINNIFKGLN